MGDVRWHPCKVISFSEIDALGKGLPRFGLAASISNGVIGVASWWSVSSLGDGKSMMGSSSSDIEKKKENPVFPNLDGNDTVGQGEVGVDDHGAVHRFHSSVVSTTNDWSYSGASATVARPPFHPLFRCFPLPRFRMDWIVTRIVLV